MVSQPPVRLSLAGWTEGVEGKVRRANHHLKVFQDEVAGFTNSDPYVIRHEMYGNATQHVVQLRYRRDPLEYMTDWALIVGDCVHNLRCALDHTVYALATAQYEGVPPDARKLQFPICDAPDDWIKARESPSVRALSPDKKAVIESLQPYNRPHVDGLRPLWMLGDLDNTDKHRRLNMAPMSIALGRADPIPCVLRGVESTNPALDTAVYHGPLISEANAPIDLVRFRFVFPAPQVQVQCDMAFQIAVRHVPADDGRTFSGAVTFLTTIAAEVRYAIDAMKPLFAAHGAAP